MEASYASAILSVRAATRFCLGLIMSKTLIAVTAIAISIGYAEAKDRRVQTATLLHTNVMNHAVCNGSSSLFEVLGGMCLLVKGSTIYGDFAELSQINAVGW